MDQSSVDDVVLVGGSTRIPKVQQLLQQFFDGKELCKNINPDEAVAYGAAVQAATLSGEGHEKIMNLVLLDVTPLSLGIAVKGILMSVIIRRNTTIPTSMQEEFCTAFDDQKSVKISVYEGERTRTEDNNLLGEFELYGLPPGPRGKVKILVTFTIDANGVLSVSAENEDTGLRKSIKIKKSGTLTAAEIERMVRDAERFKVEDEEFRRKIRAMQAFEDYVYNTRDNTDGNYSLKASVKKMISYSIKEAIEWLDANRDAEEYEYQYKKQQFEAMCNHLIPGMGGIRIEEVE
uniref:Heat shock protein 70 n=1 Tax=Daucus carota subsp. sativus TaxID=79200 RepID=A0A175YII6_DAUCS